MSHIDRKFEHEKAVRKMGATMEQKQQREDVFARFSLSGYFLLPILKKWLGGKGFAKNKEVESTVDDHFEEPDDSHYEQCVEAIERRWE